MGTCESGMRCGRSPHTRHDRRLRLEEDINPPRTSAPSSQIISKIAQNRLWKWLQRSLFVKCIIKNSREILTGTSAFSLPSLAPAHDSKMGIKQLTKMIGDNAPDAIKARPPARASPPANRAIEVGQTASAPLLCADIPTAARAQSGCLRVSRNAGVCVGDTRTTTALGPLRHPACVIWLGWLTVFVPAVCGKAGAEHWNLLRAQGRRRRLHEYLPGHSP